MINDRVILLHSSGTTEAAKKNAVLTGTTFSEGELAIITLKDDESILIKNSNNDIVEFPVINKVNSLISSANGNTLSDAKTYIDTEIVKIKVKNDDKSIITTNSDNGTDIKVNVKTGANALVLDSDGLFVDPSVLTSYEGKDSITTSDKIDNPTIKEVSLKLDANEKVLSQSVDGLLSTISLTKVTTPATGMVSQYQLVGKDGTTVLGVTIDITKDQFLESAEFIHSATADDVLIDPTVIIGDPYLKFIFHTTNDSSIVYIDVKSLVDKYIAGNGIDIVNNTISLKLDANSEMFLSNSINGLKLSGVQSAIDTIKTTIDNYTINSKPLNGNPVINGSDINLNGYVESTGSSTDLTIVSGDTVNLAFGKLSKNIKSTNTQIKNIIGFGESDNYISNTGSTYISGATSMNDADVKLDAALKEVSNSAISHILSTGNTMTVTGTNNVNLEVNPSNIAIIKDDNNDSRLQLKNGKLFASGIINCGTF